MYWINHKIHKTNTFPNFWELDNKSDEWLKADRNKL
jgi:hypothetical protein